MRIVIGIVLVLALAGCRGAVTPAPAPAVTRTVTASAGPTPADDPPSGPSARPELPFTGEPRLAYVDGHVLRAPDGSTVPLPGRWRISGIVGYAGGYLVSDDRTFEGTVGMQRLAADGSVLEEWSGTGPPLVSRDGRVAWVSLVAPESGENGPTLIHADSLDGGAEVAQEVAPARLPFLTGWFRGRLVYQAWGEGSSFLTDLVGEPVPVPRAEDLGVLRPDGAYSARPTGKGIELLHADGQLTQAFRDKGLGRTQFNDLAWEDDRRLLTTLVRGGRMCVVRIDTRNGGLSRATDWRPATYAGFAFVARTAGP